MQNLSVTASQTVGKGNRPLWRAEAGEQIGANRRTLLSERRSEEGPVEVGGILTLQTATCHVSADRPKQAAVVSLWLPAHRVLGC